MRAMTTLLLDSYRMLRSQVIFWITLGITLVVGLLYLSIGFDENGMTLLFGLASFESEFLHKGSKLAEVLYLGLFSKFIVGLWLSWVAVLLALISCASIFPSTMEEGTAGVVMTKSPSRFAVFSVRFLGSLLFVLIQVVLFTGLVFVALKWRTGVWNVSIFWYIPLVLLVFTYLYSFLVFIAVSTRSGLVAILLTIGLWAFTSVLNTGRTNLYQLSQAGNQSEDSAEGDSFRKWYKVIDSAYSIFPKTAPTLNLADELLVVNGKRGFSNGDFLESIMGNDPSFKDVDEQRDPKSSFSIIGSSLAFSFVMLGLAAWNFCRRDY